MSVSKILKETKNDDPKCVNDLIEFNKTEKWEVSKISLLEQKKTVEDSIATKQIQLDEINNLLLMFESETKMGV